MPYIEDDENQQQQANGQASNDGGGEANGQQASSGQKASPDEQGGEDGGDVKTLSGGGDSYSSSTPAAQGSSGASKGSPGGPSSSGAFTNLTSYLNQNRDQSPSTLISGKIAANGDKAQQDLSAAQQDFGQQLSNGYTAANNGIVDQAAASPTGLSDADQAAVKAQVNDAYTGPANGISDSQYYNAAEGANVGSDIKQLGNEAGQTALLQRYASRPDYTQGQQSLDQYLFQNTANGQQDINRLQSQYGQLGNQYQQAATDSANAVQNAKNEAAGASAYANQKLGGALSGIQTDINNAVSQNNTQAQDLYNRLQNELKTGQISQADSQYLPGLSNGQHFYNVNLGNYLTQPGQATAANTATSDQAAKYAALSGLLGQQNTFIPDASQAGTYSATPAFNTNGLNQAIQTAQNAYNQTVGQPTQFQFYGQPAVSANNLSTALQDAQSYLNTAQAQNNQYHNAQPAVDFYQQQLANLQAQQDNINKQNGFGNLINFLS